mmetsp:Transcript_51983/g.137918  ORF Transcript_51983/g.137918 Transcript_51983/m.137918 type:complete len:168 (+) Transcript_51983:3042-3545(+)
MEPLLYNPNLSGWWGGKVLDSPAWLRADRERHRDVRLVRASPQRRQRAAVLHQLSVALADAGLTHVAHLLSTDRGLHLRSYHEVRHQLGRSPAFSADVYRSLLDALPAAVKMVSPPHSSSVALSVSKWTCSSTRNGMTYLTTACSQTVTGCPISTPCNAVKLTMPTN